MLACEDDGVCGAAAEQTLLDRLHVKRGDLIKLGNATFRIMAVLDKRAGPHLHRLLAGAAPAGVGQGACPPPAWSTPESLVNYTYRIALNGAPADPVQARAAITEFRDRARQRFPDAGWNIRDRGDAAPGIKRFVEQLTMFLTLVGLVALGVGGVGAGQAILAFLDTQARRHRHPENPGRQRRLCLSGFLPAGDGGGAAGHRAGRRAGRGPALRRGLVSMATPCRCRPASASIPCRCCWRWPSACCRRWPSPCRRCPAPAPCRPPACSATWSRRPKCEGQNLYRAISAGAALCVAGADLGRRALAGLRGASFWWARSLRWRCCACWRKACAAPSRAMPRPKSPLVRLAFANLVRPGAATGGVVTALGLGLTLLATVTLLNATINAQVAGALPARAPSFFFVDIQPDEAAAFDKHHHRLFQRQRLQAHADDPWTDHRPERRAVGRGQGRARRQMGAERRPRHHLCRHAAARHRSSPQGKWWAADYNGPTLISLDQAIAKGTGLKIGDTMTLNVLGRSFEGRIASLRKVDFTTGGQNFVLVLSPGLIDQAPHAFLATVRVATAQENAMYMAVTDRFPNISTVRVKDAIQQVQALLASLARRRQRRQPGHHPGGAAGAGGRHRGGHPGAAL